jgi:hypothetical protein
MPPCLRALTAELAHGFIRFEDKFAGGLPWLTEVCVVSDEPGGAISSS